MKKFGNRLGMIDNGLTANQLKMIAVLAMLIDHIAWKFVASDTILGFVMHMVGRITAPIMCYFIAEGYYHTKNVRNYLKRMFIFSVLSHIAYVYYSFGVLPVFVNSNGNIQIVPYTSMIYTLMIGLLVLMVWNSLYHDIVKLVLICILCYLSAIGDWGVIGVLWVLFFGIYYKDTKNQMLSFSVIGIIAWLEPMIDANTSLIYQCFNFGIYLAIPLLCMYNGQLGKMRKRNKWFFYIFYPLHMLIIGFVYYGLFK